MDDQFQWAIRNKSQENFYANVISIEEIETMFKYSFMSTFTYRSLLEDQFKKFPEMIFNKYLAEVSSLTNPYLDDTVQLHWTNWLNSYKQKYLTESN